MSTQKPHDHSEGTTDESRADRNRSVSSGAVSDTTFKEAVEAVIFAADEPVAAEDIVGVIEDVMGTEVASPERVEDSLRGLNEEYEQSGRAFRIYEWGGGYRMATRSSLAPFLKSLFVGERESSLSRSLLETLAVVAYRQPVTRPEVDFIRGVSSDYAIRKLLERGLVDVQGRADSLGRPLLYETTERFLREFGLSDLDALPTLREVEELLEDPAFDEERAKLFRLDAEEDVEFVEDGSSSEEA